MQISRIFNLFFPKGGARHGAMLSIHWVSFQIAATKWLISGRSRWFGMNLVRNSSSS